jgi:chlorobactene glucosyltransferase
MLYQQAVTVVLLGILLNVLLNLRALRRPKAEQELPDPAPLISVLVPARNEEANIGPCLKSLCGQDYPNFEVVVLDDASTDRTAQIVEGIAAGDPRVSLVSGQPLPEGWAGKPYACHQLAQQARGSWLLFTDADTVHAPFALRYALTSALASQAAFVSGFPHQRNSSIWQKMAMPIFFYFMLVCAIPFWLLQRFPRNISTVAIGQFMFFSSDAYRSIGGHEAVKSRIVEDVALGRAVAHGKHKQLILDLSSVVSCEMYREVGSMWEGIGRWLSSAASLSTLGLALAMVAVFLLFLAPFLWLAHGLLLGDPSFGWQALVLLQVAFVLIARYLTGRRFSQPTVSTLLHPLGVGFSIAAAIHACYLHMTGAGVSWKERVYGPNSQIT